MFLGDRTGVNGRALKLGVLSMIWVGWYRVAVRMRRINLGVRCLWMSSFGEIWLRVIEIGENVCVLKTKYFMVRK